MWNERCCAVVKTPTLPVITLEGSSVSSWFSLCSLQDSGMLLAADTKPILSLSLRFPAALSYTDVLLTLYCHPGRCSRVVVRYAGKVRNSIGNASGPCISQNVVFVRWGILVRFTDELIWRRISLWHSSWFAKCLVTNYCIFSYMNYWWYILLDQIFSLAV